MSKHRRSTLLAQILAILAIVLVLGGIVPWWINAADLPNLWPLVEENFAAIIGLPMAAVSAFIVVAVLREGSENPIKFEALGFKFEGTSGAVVLWLMCFLGIAICIKLLW